MCMSVFPVCIHRSAMDVLAMKLVGVVTRQDLRSTLISTMDTPSSKTWAVMNLFYINSNGYITLHVHTCRRFMTRSLVPETLSIQNPSKCSYYNTILCTGKLFSHPCSLQCMELINQMSMMIGKVNIYDIYTPCFSNLASNMSKARYHTILNSYMEGQPPSR